MTLTDARVANEQELEVCRVLLLIGHGRVTKRDGMRCGAIDRPCCCPMNAMGGVLLATPYPELHAPCRPPPLTSVVTTHGVATRVKAAADG